MRSEIHILPLKGHFLYAYLIDGVLIDCLMTTLKGERDIGAIYLAKADRILKGAGGMFMDIGLTEKVFLRTKKSLRPGQLIPVQVVQYADSDKPMRVSELIDYRGPFVVLTPDRMGINLSRKITQTDHLEKIKPELEAILPPNCGLILRSSAMEAELAAIKEDISDQISRMNAVLKHEVLGLIRPAEVAMARAKNEWSGGKLYLHEEKFPDHIAELLVRALDHPIKLKSGGHIYLERTKALIAVDVNTGSNTELTAAKETNREALAQITNWLRLMGWGGQLVIDFAPMPAAAQANLAQSFLKQARQSGLGFSSRGFGPLGMLEGTIHQERLPLPNNLFDFL